MEGYSDRINHALAFAAKHHDEQVRRGTRLPYFTRPANVAIILTRYRCDDKTVLAGILHNVLEDYARSGYSREMLDRRLGDKFGREVLEIAMAVVEHRADAQGIELSAEDRRENLLSRLADADSAGLWVASANALHNAATLLADVQRTVDPGSVWTRFAAGRLGTIDWYRRLLDRLRDIGFNAPIVSELAEVVEKLERLPA